MARSDARLDAVPHFDVTTLDGRRIRYQDIWQRRNLVLAVVSAADRDGAARYASELQARERDFDREETTVVVTADAVTGLPAPAVVVADRWGEIFHLEAASGSTSNLSDVDELLSWVHFVEIQCPECPP
ncbi:MAG TPA: hypothetical protein VH436_08050 [Vicinamibacterales bacterium]|jgi:hypothetical protein